MTMGMDPGSMMGGMGGGMMGGGGGQSSTPAPPTPAPQPAPVQFRPNQAGPVTIQPTQLHPQQVMPSQVFTPQTKFYSSEPMENDEDPDDMSHGITAARGTAAGNAARQSSLQTAINNFHAAQALSAQSTPAETQQKPATQSQLNLAQLAQRVQSDTAMETAAQSSQNPNTQWASQQPVNPANVQDMNDAEDYVNQNAYTPAGLFGGNGG
jgi:hypothetical protein